MKANLLFLGHFRLDAGSFPDEFEDLDEQPLVLTGSRSMPSGSMESATEAATVEANPPSSPEQQLVGNRPLHNGNAFPSDEVFCISVNSEFGFPLDQLSHISVPYNALISFK